VTGQLERARETLKVVALGEAALAIAGRAPLPAGGKPTVLDLGSATAEEKRAFSENVNQWWPTSGLDSSVAVAFVLGGDSRDKTWQVQHLLPAGGDGRTCITLVPTQTWMLAARMPGQRALELRFATELGPCLFMASYGRPGPRIEQWMGRRGLNYVAYFNPSGRSIVESMDIPEDYFVKYSIFELEWARYGAGPLATKCLRGLTKECGEGVASSDPGMEITRGGFHMPLPAWRAPFGSLTSSFLADLHREIGSVKFREFWHSPGTVDQAIHQVTGKSLGEWTHQWALGRRNAFRPGPLPQQRSVLRVAGLTTLLLGLAAIYSVRRTVR
jgi:hypothetical protein